MAQSTISLDGTWKFKYCKDKATADQLVANKFYAVDYNDAAFDSQPVPSNWPLQGYEEPTYRGYNDNIASEGLYIKDFTLNGEEPSANKRGNLRKQNKRILLHFGGVWASCDVWLNGKFQGRHDSGYTSFTIDVSGSVNRTGNNRLAVRVRQVYKSYKFDVYDDWTLPGIYRPVTIEMMPNLLYIDHVQCESKVESVKSTVATLTARVFVTDMQKLLLPGNYPSPGFPYMIKAVLKDKVGNIAAECDTIIPAHVSTGRQTDIVMMVKNPKLWNAEQPNLYNLTIGIYLPKGVTPRGAKPVAEGVVDALAAEQQDRSTLEAYSSEWDPTPYHTWSDNIGLREVTTTKDGKPMLCINGQPVKLRGVNYHNEYPTVGRAETHDIWLKDLQMMKETNINYLRLCHYQHAEEFMHLCDSLGFYCTEEIALGGASTLMYDPSENPAALQRTYETVTRDWNRPSVIAWTVGNEDAFTPLHQAAARACKAFDPTRPRLIPWRYENHLPMDDIDILSVHYWHPKECDSLTAQANRPVISTEYTHAFGEMGMGGLDKRFRAMTKHPQGAGAAIWMWQDQGLQMSTALEKGKNNIMRKGNAYLRLSDAGWDGIVDTYRNKTRDWEETREVYNPVYPVSDTLQIENCSALRLSTNWSARELKMENSIPCELYNGYDFTNMNTVRMQWQSFDGKGKMIKKGVMQLPDCQPHSTATVSLPYTAKVAYYHLTFIGANGVELGVRSLTIENVTSTSSATKMANTKTAKILNSHFSILNSMKPCVWRKIDNSEESVIGKKLVRKAPKDWSKYTVKDLGDASLREPQGKLGSAQVHSYLYTWNDSNTVQFSYTTKEVNGGIRVDYTIKPTLSVPIVPVLGVSLTMPNDMKDLKWRGLGPVNCYSNKQRAGIDGVWTIAKDANPGLAGSLGTKRYSWVETNGYHIDGDGYIEVDKGNTLRLLIGVAARPEKGRKANDEFPEFGSTKESPSYHGWFIIRK